MARYDASINLLVTGQQKVEALLSSVERFQGVVDSLKSTPIDLNITNFNKKLAEGQRKIVGIDEKANRLYNERITTIEKIAKLNDRIAQKEKIISESTSTTTKKYQEAVRIRNSAIEEQTKLQDKLNESIDQSNKLANVRSSLVGNQESVRALRQQVGFARTLANSYLELGDARKYTEGKGFGGRNDLVRNETSISQIKQQAISFEQLANNTRMASREFNRFTVAAQLASQKAGKAQIEQLSVLAEAFSPAGQAGIKPRFKESEIAGARASIASLIGSYSGIAKSEAALSAYADQLRTIQSLVPYTSNEFRALEEAIAAVNQEISGIGRRGQSSAIQALSGPATDLGSLKAFQQRESYQKRVNDQLAKQAAIEDRINRANISDSQKLELRNQLESAATALAEDQLSLAQRLTREIDRQRMSMERANRSQKTLVFGALGTDFSPVTGELPSTVTPGGQKIRNLIPGSPAARLEEARANRESTQAAVALAKQKLSATEQEAEELRRGTQAATALGKQKLKALEDQAKILREETAAAVSLAQQKMREEEKIVADAWKMRGGPALPPGFTEKGPITPKATGQFSPVEGQRRLNNILASGAIIQQGLINLQGKGADVTDRLIQLETALNAAKQDGYEISLKNLNALTDEVSLAGKFAQLQRSVLAGQAGGGGKGGKAADGYKAAFTTEQARAKISEIVRNFNAAVSSNAGTQGIGENIASSFSANLKSGASAAASAATSFASAALDAIKKVFGIASPSRVMKEIASNLISSFIVELISNIPSVKAALEKTFNPKTAYEQAGRAPQRGPGMAMELDPGLVAAMSGSPLPSGASTAAGVFQAGYTQPRGMGLYRMQQRRFPVESPAELFARRNQPSDANRVVSEAINEYRAAVDNFWEGEDSQFQAITRILTSSARLGAARLARTLRQRKDLSPEQQFQQQFDQVAAQARSAISAGQRSGSFQRFSVGQLGQILQSLSDSVINSVESLSYTISDAFRDRVSQITNQVDRAVSSGLSGLSGAIERIRGVGGGGNGGGGNGGGGNGGGAGGGAGGVNLQRFLDLGDLAPLARATNQQLEVLEANLVNVRNGLARTDPAFDRITNRLRQLGREQERRAPGATPLTRKFGTRTANAISEGLIGGAFPLLFGQGLGASAFGLAGGAAGGFAGGGLGFGLSLLGTALGTAFDQLSQAAQDTGKALRYPIEGFEKLKEAGLFASKQQEFYIQKLIDSGKATEAAALIQKQIASKIGPQGVNDLTRLGKASDELSKAWATLYLEIQAAIAGPLAGLLEWVKSIVQASSGGAQKQAFALDPEAFKKAQTEAQSKARKNNIFGAFLPRDESVYQKELNRLSGEIISKNIAKLPEIKPAEFTPDQIESNRQKAQQAADEIKQAYRSAFQLQRQGIDLEIQAADNRRKVENDIFAKRQEAARVEADNARTAAQVRIESTDLALRKSFSGAEGEARTILGAVREYIKVRATGEADINKKRRDLEVTMADIQQETSNYIFEQAKTRLQLERSIEDYKRQVSDYQLENQRKIQQLRDVEMAGGAAGGLGAAVQRIGGAWQFRGTSLQKNMRKGDYLSDPRENFFFDFRKDLIPAAQARIKTLSKKDIAALAFTVLTEAGPTDIGKLDVAANLVTRSAGMGNAPISQVAKQPGQYAGVFPYTRAQLESTAEGKRLFGKEYDRVAKLIAGQASDVRMSPIYSRGPTAAQAGNVKEGSRVGYAQPAYQYQQAASQLAPVSPSLDVNTPGMIAAQERLKQLAQDRLKIEQQLSNLGIDAALLGITEAARGESNIIALENELKLEKNRYQAILENSGASANEVAIINQKLAGQAKLSLTKDYELQALQLINDATKKGLITQDESKKLTDAIKEGIKDRLLFLRQEIGLEEEKLRVQQQQESAQRLANVEREIALADIGLKFGYIGEAARAFRQELDISGSVVQAQQFADAVQRLETLPGRQIAAEYDAAATSLQKLATWENVAVTGAKSISEGFGQAFREIAAGTASAQEILAGFFQNLANSFADMAAQMISNMLQMLIYKQLLGPMLGFNPGGGFGGFGAGLGSAAFGGGLASGSSWGGFLGALAMPLLGGAGFFADGGMFADGIKPYADGGMFADGIKPFADGGIVDSPTLFKFADGGALSNGVMGEAGPEAIMPLSRGSDGRLGVEGGGGDVNVTVNVDASGSKVQGDDQKSSQLGRALAAAVREELLKQKRPGGLLQ